jgi:3(or 17)beta-hydroxysteroid dehydrogenase
LPDARDFAAKVALVTGAASGIGAATARLLAARGARVWFADLDANACDAARTGIAASEALALDVRDPAAWHATEARIGAIHVLVNAAGISRTANPAGIAEVVLDDWRAIFAVNVEGTLLGCQTAMRLMADSGGAIVNLASTAGIAPSAALGAYGASKAAVAQMTRSVATACAAHGLAIRCNAVQPGMVETPMNHGMPADYRRAWEEQIPAHRFGRVEEVAQAICFLASDAAGYINGEALLIDGGLMNRAVIGSDTAWLD